jgi:hypothetical protein
VGYLRGLVSVGCGCLIAAGSSVQATAQKDWYPADAKSLVPGFTHGVEGKPFVGTATWTTHGRDEKYGDFYTNMYTATLMRDGMGRERMTWSEGDGRVTFGAGLDVVLVLDPVARCVMLWEIDGTDKGLDAKARSVNVVKVRCEPQGVEVPVRAKWNALTEEEMADLKVEPESKPEYRDVLIGTAEVGGVEAKRYRHEELRTFGAGKRLQRTNEGQRWYSDALDMVVRTAGAEGSDDPEEGDGGFVMSKVKLGEPAEGAFKVPEGATVEVDPKLQLVWRGQGGSWSRMRALQGPREVDGHWPDIDMQAISDEAGKLVHPPFPEAWYTGGPTVAMPAFFDGPKGKPFQAKGQWMQYGPEVGGNRGAMQIWSFDLAQDSEGRARLRVAAANGAQAAVTYVLDPVAGCVFFWPEEPFQGIGSAAKTRKPMARVRCNARGVAMPKAPPWDDLNDDEKAERTNELRQMYLDEKGSEAAETLKFVNEKVSEGMFGNAGTSGVKAIKYAHYEMHVGKDGTVRDKVKTEELWYAPELDLVVKTRIIPKVTARDRHPHGPSLGPHTVFEMTSIEVGEPKGDFYPPYGYAIEVDQRLLPPFAPTPKTGQQAGTAP